VLARHTSPCGQRGSPELRFSLRRGADRDPCVKRADGRRMPRTTPSHADWFPAVFETLVVQTRKLTPGGLAKAVLDSVLAENPSSDKSLGDVLKRVYAWLNGTRPDHFYRFHLKRALGVDDEELGFLTFPSFKDSRVDRIFDQIVQLETSDPKAYDRLILKLARRNADA
jgi:hypothetical protein